jgi:hypothetical protein
MIPNINLNLILSIARLGWRHKMLSAFLIGLTLIFSTPDDSFGWQIGAVLLFIALLPAAAGLRDWTLFSSLFSRRRRADEHERGAKIVSAKDLTRVVEKSER